MHISLKNYSLNFSFNTFVTSFFVSLFIVFALLIISYIVSYRLRDPERHTAYECGFEPFGEAHTLFDIKFYLIAVLFLVFDLEVLFLIPWIVLPYTYSNLSVMLLFLFILTAGYFYEYKEGLLSFK